MAKSEFDIAVIGAGAAGIAAGRILAQSGADFVILEARGRAGGRAWTVSDRCPWPLDLGCFWLHSADRNPWCAIAEELGFTLDKNAPPWSRRASNPGFSEAEQDEWRAASEAFYDRLEAARALPGDAAASDFLDPACRWNALLDAGSSYYNGIELDQVSVQDFGNYIDTGVNWRVAEGYGAVIVAAAAGLPIRYDCAVRRIDRSGARLRLLSSQGAIAARAAIVTLSSNILAEGRLSFVPALADKAEAAALLPLGHANKVILGLDRAEIVPAGGRLHGAIDRAAAGSYNLRPFGRPLIEGYFGGTLARALEAEGEQAFAAFAIDELAAQLGSAVRDRLRVLAVTGWCGDPWALGGYSHALPGHAGARDALAAPVEDRLFFAGEACSRHSFSTAHGAYATGIHAAALAVSAIASGQNASRAGA